MERTWEQEKGREGVSSGSLQVLCECYTVDIEKLLLFPAEMSRDIVNVTVWLLTNCGH